ncbi:ATPase domain-containing protein [Anaerolineales bacterium HSG6]|nr:ATPase domain-containing protein [Anaerolineales bacterium HSG6]MDM8531932.1 ATPase domain-containing protein [Anaerolineales bacterium HSG25]
MKLNRVKTGISGLDEMLGGGFLAETANLVEGAPGTGKTTLGMQFIYNGIVKHQEPGLIITFEQFPEQFYQTASTFGWDFVDLERRGLLKIVMTSPEVSRVDLKRVDGIIEQVIQNLGVKRVMIDSISHFSRLTQDPIQSRELKFAFLNAFKRYGITTVLTSEGQALLGEAHGNDTVGFIVDSYLILRYVEIESTICKALLVLKMRGSHHAKDIRQYDITAQGIQIQSKFAGQSGILSGYPHQMTDSFVKAFVKP